MNWLILIFCWQRLSSAGFYFQFDPVDKVGVVGSRSERNVKRTHTHTHTHTHSHSLSHTQQQIQQHSKPSPVTGVTSMSWKLTFPDWIWTSATAELELMHLPQPTGRLATTIMLTAMDKHFKRWTHCSIALCVETRGTRVQSTRTRQLALTVSKHIKGSKERYLLGQNTTCEFSGVIPFTKLQNDT